MRHNIRTTGLIFECLAILTGFAIVTKAQSRNVKKEAEKFHQRLKTSAFAKIYSNASVRLRRKISEKDFLEKLRNDMSRLGKIKTIANTGFPAPNPVTALAKGFKNEAVVFLITGTKSSIYEVLIWDMTGKQPKLAIYNTDFSAGPVSRVN